MVTFLIKEIIRIIKIFLLLLTFFIHDESSAQLKNISGRRFGRAHLKTPSLMSDFLKETFTLFSENAMYMYPPAKKMMER